MEENKKLSARVISIEGIYFVLTDEKIGIGDPMLDYESYLGGFNEEITTCHTIEECEVANLPESGFKKVISSSQRTNWFFNQGSPHEFNYSFGNGRVEPMTDENYRRIIETGGSCYVFVTEDGSYRYFGEDGLIIAAS